MVPIQDLLNKIKWDERENPEDYILLYFDRVKQKLKELKYTEIKRIEGTFMLVDISGKEINIPLHRIRKVQKQGEIVWERPPQKVEESKEKEENEQKEKGEKKGKKRGETDEKELYAT